MFMQLIYELLAAPEPVNRGALPTTKAYVPPAFDDDDDEDDGDEGFGMKEIDKAIEGVSIAISDAQATTLLSYRISGCNLSTFPFQCSILISRSAWPSISLARPRPAAAALC
jgi:hypothetical protein